MYYSKNEYLRYYKKSYVNFDIYPLPDYDNIPEKNLKPYYVLINIFENTLILQNENDVLALLINCLIYNCPNLILKSISQIKTIIKNYNIDKTLLKSMMIFSKNIYSLLIHKIIFDNHLNNYNYYYNYKIFKKYNYYCTTKNINVNTYHNIIKLSIDNNNDLIKDIIIKIFKQIIYKSDYKSEIIRGFGKSPQTKININYPYDNSGMEVSYDNERETRIYRKGEKINICKLKFEVIKFSGIKLGENYNVYDMKIIYSENIINYQHINNITFFQNLLEVNIPNFNNISFDKNIKIAQNLFHYLVNNDNTLYPIQELIMGSGKSSVITPYTILLLYNYFINNNNFDASIYIVVPEFLLNQTFETIMTNISPMCFEIDIILFSKNYTKTYNNSISLIIISDTDLKELFLSSNIDHNTNSYFIYDEIDTISNPITNELNIPIHETKKTIDGIDLIYEITKIIYSNIFINDDFWNIEPISEVVVSNMKHKYFLKMTDSNFIILMDEIKKNIYNELKKKYVDDIKNINILVSYFEKNIIKYIFTKQFNFDYGLPLEYKIKVPNEYKYKAIPYLGGDAPLYGSSFSDTILSYVLTYFSYKLLYPKLRLLDIENILNSPDIQLFNSLTKNFKININTIDDYKKNKMHYLNNLNENFILDDNFLELYIQSCLNKNITYYEKCKNISFTELLLKKNVNNYVGFTGTAYIQLPKQIDVLYMNNVEIIKSPVSNKNNVEVSKTVEEAVKSIILSDRKMLKFYKNKNNTLLINNIFDCINNYNVLIDIGAVFINLSNDDFIKKYNEVSDKKKYFVYFNNGIKIYNTITNQYEKESSLNKKNDETFFYFSNKNITGVDAKKFMSDSSHALVTISINTTLRDFSQGIFRMRNIMDNQSFDLLIDCKMVNNVQFGGNCFEKIKMTDREIIFNILKFNQDRLEESKKKILLKQNIIGLLKNSTDESDYYLYIDPLNNLYDNINSSFEYMNSKYKSSNLSDYNLCELIKNNNDNPISLIHSLLNKYFSTIFLEINACNNIETQVETQVEKQVETQVEKVFELNLNSLLDITMKEKLNVFLNTTIYTDILENFIYFFNDVKLKDVQMIIIYNNIKNNLYIMPITYLDTIFNYNDIYFFIENFTIMKIYNDTSYGYYKNNINYYMLKLIAMYLLEKHMNKSYLSVIEISHINKNKDIFKELLQSFTKIFNFNINLLGGKQKYVITRIK